MAIVFLGVGLMGFGMGFRSNMYFSMLADVADYGEWQSGRNLAGTQMAVNGFSNKVSSACASAIVAGLLAWGAYDGTVAVQSYKSEYGNFICICYSSDYCKYRKYCCDVFL